MPDNITVTVGNSQFTYVPNKTVNNKLNVTFTLAEGRTSATITFKTPSHFGLTLSSFTLTTASPTQTVTIPKDCPLGDHGFQTDSVKVNPSGCGEGPMVGDVDVVQDPTGE